MRAFGRRTLRTLFLPGTHDSSTFGALKSAKHFACTAVCVCVCVRVCCGSSIRAVLQTQLPVPAAFQRGIQHPTFEVKWAQTQCAPWPPALCLAQLAATQLPDCRVYSFAQQLRLGVRYLDLRASWHEHKQTVVMSHSFETVSCMSCTHRQPSLSLTPAVCVQVMFEVCVAL